MIEPGSFEIWAQLYLNWAIRYGDLVVERPVFESRPGPPHTLQGSPRGGGRTVQINSVLWIRIRLNPWCRIRNYIFWIRIRESYQKRPALVIDLVMVCRLYWLVAERLDFFVEYWVPLRDQFFFHKFVFIRSFFIRWFFIISFFTHSFFIPYFFIRSFFICSFFLSFFSNFLLVFI